MTQKITIDAPAEIADWQLKEIALLVREAVNSLTDFEAGKANMRRSDFSTTLIIELDKP